MKLFSWRRKKTKKKEQKSLSTKAAISTTGKWSESPEDKPLIIKHLESSDKSKDHESITSRTFPIISQTENVLDILDASTISSSVDKRKDTARISFRAGDAIDITTKHMRGSVDEFLGIQRDSIDGLMISILSNNQEFFGTQSDTASESHTDHEYIHECNKVLETLQISWGVELDEFTTHSQLHLSRSPLVSKTDAVVVMEGWNKALAFRSMFSEAIVLRWRMIVAMSNLEMNEDDECMNSSVFIMPETLNIESSSLVLPALHAIEENTDPIARCLGLRIHNIESLVLGMLDMSVRELCPHTQIVSREAYTPLLGSADEDAKISEPFIHEEDCKSLDEYCFLFARYGLKPEYWVDFCKAFVWAMKTHNPYANQQQDIDAFEKPNNKSEFGTFVAGMIAVPAIEAGLNYYMYLQQSRFSRLRSFHLSFGFREKLAKSQFHQDFILKIFKQHPELKDHLSENSTELIKDDFCCMLDNLVENMEDIRNYDSDIRKLLAKLGKDWSNRKVPFDLIVLLGNEYLDAVSLLFHDEFGPSLAIKLEMSLAYLYKEAIHFVMQPFIIHRNLHNKAVTFYKDVAAELNWSKQILQKRMVEVNAEIDSTGSYTQTTEEIEIGARLAWRNSGKCIGRIAWNTLKIRDCRHLSFSASRIFREIDAHIQIASGGTNIESVMTVFRPQQPHEPFGLRFWSDQIFRYAGYRNSDGETLGDPANAEFTEFLIKSKLWDPPNTRGAFDLLPLVLKMPKIDKPFTHIIPEHLRYEVEIEHPDFPAVKELGLKWPAVPAITSFKLNLGGICYPCAPFNGWFVSTEIVRNLLERYSMTVPLAQAMNIPLNDRMLAQKVSAETENAILHSFEKAEYTIVDPMTVGKSYLTHCKRERHAGRECPGQWSWIGGLAGPTNPTWHLEMRDFSKEPQFAWGCHPWDVLSVGDRFGGLLIDNAALLEQKADNKAQQKKIKLPRVLIAYGSETGTAEAAANSLARKLKACMPVVMSLNDAATKADKIPQEYTHLLGICSTFGNGEPPSNARDFFDLSLQSMSGVQFSVLALGSSLYPKFCQAGKDLHEKIVDAGGDILMSITCVDGVGDAQSKIVQWTEQMQNLVLPDSLLEDFFSTMSQSNEKSADVTKYEIKWRLGSTSVPLQLEDFQHCRKDSSLCTQNMDLFTKSKTETKYIEFELTDGLTYETGDHLVVCPLNNISLIKRFIACFTHELEIAAAKNGYYDPIISKQENQNQLLSPSIIWQVQQPFYLESGVQKLVDIPHLTNVSLLEALQVHLDLALSQESYTFDLISMMDDRLKTSPISLPKAGEFKILAQATTKMNQFPTDIYPTIVHLLEEFRSVFCEQQSESPLLSLADLMVHMPRLNPRYYSISSSNASSPSSVTITYDVITKETNNDQDTIKGVCSSYLSKLKPGDRAKIAIRTSLRRMPGRKDAPMIMIGENISIASFVGFLHERSKEFYSSSNNIRECHVFYGCKTRNEILYKDELLSWQSINIIKLYLALSDDDDDLVPKEYVQDKLQQHSKKLSELLQREYVRVYVCGTSQLAASSTHICIEALTTHGGMSRVAAVRKINQMRVEHEWTFDIYDNVDFTTTTELQEASNETKRVSKLVGEVWSSSFLSPEEEVIDDGAAFGELSVV